MSGKRFHIPLEQPPIEIVRGAQIKAEYLPQEVPLFRNNPLIEALPPTLTPPEVTEYLLQLPPYSEKDLKMSPVARLQITETAREFFVPHGKHLTVYYALTNLILRGYVRRNPVLWGYWKRIQDDIASFQTEIQKHPFPNSRARGLAIVGIGGTGKSTTVEKILQSLPQVITHVLYKDQDFIMKQLVWLKLDCPRIGSLRELCVNFFRAVDEILETTYEERYAGRSRRTLETLIQGMARVAANHCLGIIVIDEIQDLSEARSGGEITIVNFLVHLENTIGIPFALVGTPNAIPLLSAQFRQTRRVTEQGYIAWDRMAEVEQEVEVFDDDDEDEVPIANPNISEELPPPCIEGGKKEKTPQPDPVWKDFLETLWTYRYVKQPRPLKPNILEDKCARALYSAGKGIPAIVQTVFVLAQQRAILNETEKITPRLIRETVRDNQKLIEEILGEARMKRPRTIPQVGDLVDLDQVYEAEDTAEQDTDDEMDVTTGGGTSSERSGSKVGPKCDEAATKFPAQVGVSLSDRKVKNINSKPAPKRFKFSKDDLRNATTRAGAETKSGGFRKNDKYGRSPEDYLKEK
jgi:hypothetical protein